MVDNFLQKKTKEDFFSFRFLPLILDPESARTKYYKLQYKGKTSCTKIYFHGKSRGNVLLS